MNEIHTYDTYSDVIDYMCKHLIIKNFVREK